MDYTATSGILKALGHPIRLEIVNNLSKDECNVNRMVERLGIPQSTVSQHLRILQDKGLIEPHKKGVITCYKVIHPFVKKLLKISE